MGISEEIQRIIASSRNIASKLHRASCRHEKPPRVCGENAHFSDQHASAPGDWPRGVAWNRPPKYALARIPVSTTPANAAKNPHAAGAALGASCPRAEPQRQTRAPRVSKSLCMFIPLLRLSLDMVTFRAL